MSIWQEIQLRTGNFYFLRLDGEDLPVIAFLEGWTSGKPVFAIVGRDEEGPTNAVVLGETRSPFRERDAGDPPLA